MEWLRQFPAVTLADEQLGYNPPVGCIGIEKCFTTVAAVEAFHSLGGVLKCDQLISALINVHLLFLPGRH